MWFGIVITKSPSAGLYVAVVGVDPVPNSIISNIVSKEDDNLDIRVSEPTNEEVYCVPLPLLTNPSIVLVNIGKVLTELVFVLTNVWFDWGKCCIA